MKATKACPKVFAVCSKEWETASNVYKWLNVEVEPIVMRKEPKRLKNTARLLPVDKGFC